MKRTNCFIVTAVFLLSSCTGDDSTSATINISRVEQNSGTDALFIGISPVDENIVWLSGTAGTYSRTVDGGTTWHTSTVPGADSLQFRDVHAFDENRAYLMSIGSGEQSKIFRTVDGGDSWDLVFQNTHENGFFDCIDFFDEETGLGFSDSVEDGFIIIKTTDGTNWNRIDPAVLPPALEGEGSFAASGTCLRVVDDNTAVIGTGAAERPRVLITRDRGDSWSAVDVPITGGTGSRGITSVSAFDSDTWMVVGGDIAAPDSFTTNVIVTHDGGNTWETTEFPVTPGAFYGSSPVPGTPSHTLVAVGPAGVDMTMDYGKTWMNLDTLNYWSTAFVSPNAGWTVGTDGKVVKWDLFSEE